MEQKEKEKELIKHAAVKSVDGMIFIGKQHADCFEKAHYISIKMSSKRDDQGFMTSKGRYVDRVEGAKIATEAGQVGLSDNDDDEDPFNTGIKKPITLLFSENLWSPIYNGKHNYSELRGYLLKESTNEL